MKNTVFPQAFQCYKPRCQKVFGVILISKYKNVLLVKGRKVNKWSFPKGHLQSDESSFDCAMRECFEETGICLKDTNYNHYKKLYSGGYFIYLDTEEYNFNIQDNLEICDIAWIPWYKLRQLRKNIDVSKFLELNI